MSTEAMSTEAVALPTQCELSADGYDGEKYEERYARFAARTADLDLTLIKRKVMHPNPNIGYGWSAEFTDRLEAEYRVFFTMHAAFPTLWLPPSRVMDLFWHEHILDTRAYFADCDHVAGHYVHHMPYFGMRNEADAELVVAALDTERELYVRCVGLEPPPDLWILGFTVEKMQALVGGQYSDPDATEAALAAADLPQGERMAKIVPRLPQAEPGSDLERAAALAAQAFVNLKL